MATTNDALAKLLANLGGKPEPGMSTAGLIDAIADAVAPKGGQKKTSKAKGE